MDIQPNGDWSMNIAGEDLVPELQAKVQQLTMENIAQASAIRKLVNERAEMQKVIDTLVTERADSEFNKAPEGESKHDDSVEGRALGGGSEAG